MVNSAFPISFEYRLDHDSIEIGLRAEVEVNKSPLFYIVRNIRSRIHGNSPAIPEMRLTRKARQWVHLDSLKPTLLTLCIGDAIDAYEHQ